MPTPDPKVYETLLRVRQRQEDLRAQSLAEVRRREMAAQHERDALGQEQQRMLVEAGSRLTQHFDAADVRRYFQHERHLARLGDDKDAEIRALQALAEERRAALEAASKRRRMVERLQARKQAAYRRHLNKLDQQQTDETATAYAARGLAPGAERPGDKGSKR